MIDWQERHDDTFQNRCEEPFPRLPRNSAIFGGQSKRGSPLPPNQQDKVCVIKVD